MKSGLLHSGKYVNHGARPESLAELTADQKGWHCYLRSGVSLSFTIVELNPRCRHAGIGMQNLARQQCEHGCHMHQLIMLCNAHSLGNMSTQGRFAILGRTRQLECPCIPETTDGWTDGRGRMEAVPEGIQIRSLARSLTRSSTGLPHLAHSHCTKSYVRRRRSGHGEHSKWLVAFTCRTVCRGRGAAAGACSGLVGWMARGSHSVIPSACVRVRRWSNAIMSRPRRKTASYFQERHELPPSH